jgi:hypothetical protein
MSDNEKGNLEKVGEGIGAMAGKAADTAFNLMTTLFGSAAGRLTDWGTTEDEECRTHFEKHGGRHAESYDAVRPLYQFGHLAGSNPDYQGRSFEDVESDLQTRWSEAGKAKEYGEWQSVRDYIGTGYTKRETRGDGMM